MPVYIAAMGPRNLRLTGEVADGWLGNAFIPESAEVFLEPLREGAESAGRTLADLIGGRETELTSLPWVGHISPDWEPEPMRWLGVNMGLRVMGSADGVETRTGRPALRARVFARFLG